ncbi:MAG TPA: glycoside hydrolase family 32 protein [Fodinibius sp.]|nr:glycoside hydrolase family 32 protein [Fodinibius sp.]
MIDLHLQNRILNLISLLAFWVAGCASGNLNSPGPKEDNEPEILQCEIQTEETDYVFYKRNADARIGDVMPLYNSKSGKFYIYYLKDIWNDATHERHPWYGYTTTNFYDYSQISAGEIIGSNPDPCAQDYAIGTGSIIKKGSTYYAFYTGHNPNYPSDCVSTKEGIMLATSSSLDQSFTKDTSFSTIYAPTGMGYDEQNNFRDPYVYYDSGSEKYYMILSARKDVNGTWKGVIAQYSSTDLVSWNYEGVLYDGGDENFFIMETPELFKMGNTYYLLFSDSDSRYVFYRKSTSINGPWHKPESNKRIVGKGIYAAKTASNNHDRYIFGWTHANENHSDLGSPLWGGNLVAHKLYQKENGDLAVTIPHTLESFVETQDYTIEENSTYGNVQNTGQGSHSYQLISEKEGEISSVVFEPVEAERYQIEATFSYTQTSGDFGFLVGACDGTNDFVSLRLLPDQGVFRVDKKPRDQLFTTTEPTNDVPIQLSPDTDYNIRIVIENSMVVVYIDNHVALSTRIYSVPGNHWGIFSGNSKANISNITVTTP